jgi:3-methylcrotonyl-CoA carboxylase alpha subunit
MSEKSVTIGDQQFEVALERDGSRLRSGEHEIELIEVRDGEIELLTGGEQHVVPYSVDGTSISFAFRGEIWFADVAERGSRARARHRDQTTTAPMPGVVLKILVQAGDTVAKGAPLLILEAMKMEHPVIAPRAGSIARINCTEGELVQPGVELVTFEPAE